MPHPTNPNIRCDRCKAFDPQHEECRLQPPTRLSAGGASWPVVLDDHWCRKFQAATPPAAHRAPWVLDAVHVLMECRAALGALQAADRLLPPQIQSRVNAAFWSADDSLRDAFLDGIPVEDIAAAVARKHTATPTDTPDAQT